MNKINQKIKDIKLQNIQIIRNIIIFEEYEINNEVLYKTINKNKLRVVKLSELKDEMNRKDGIIGENKDDEKIYKTHGNCLKKSSGCNGFINHEWECGVCFTKVCSKCYSFKNKEHECDPNEVESIKTLKEILCMEKMYQ